MAVVRSIPGVKITVWSSGKRLKEYRCDIGAPGNTVNKVVSRYLKATTDVEFYFKISVSDSYRLDSPNLLFDIYVDGISVGGVLCGEYELIHGSWTKKVEGVKEPTEKRDVIGLRKFRFSELTTENVSNPAKAAQDRRSALRIGELQVKVHRCSSFYTLTRGPVDVKSDLSTISKEALEARRISHGTTYSPTKRILENATIYDVTYVDGEDNPLAVFNFSYRSKEILAKELFRKENESKIKYERVEPKRKRTEETFEDVAYQPNDNESFTTMSGLARKMRKSDDEHTEIETINLIDDSDGD